MWKIFFLQLFFALRCTRNLDFNRRSFPTKKLLYNIIDFNNLTEWFIGGIQDTVGYWSGLLRVFQTSHRKVKIKISITNSDQFKFPPSPANNSRQLIKYSRGNQTYRSDWKSNSELQSTIERKTLNIHGIESLIIH